jgi:hypothetical protein
LNYTITSSAGTGGTITPSGSTSAVYGISQTYLYTPNAGYEINQVFVDGVNNPTAAANGSYTFTHIAANHTISVSFKQKTLPVYTISAAAGDGGNIYPSGEVTVSQGGSQMFTFAPISGYEINQALIDGVNSPAAVADGGYTFTNVTSAHSILVTFKPGSNGQGLSVSQPNLFYPANGSSQAVTVKSSSSWTAVSSESWLTISQTAGTGDATLQITAFPNTAIDYRTALITVSDGVQTTLTIPVWQDGLNIIYTINAIAGIGGTITKSGMTTAEQGSSVTYEFTPNSGYEVSQVLIDGVNNPAAVASRSYTFDNVADNHAIAVSFKPTSGTSIEPVGTAAVWYANSILSIQSPAAEKVTIFSISGLRLWQSSKPAGEMAFNISHLPNGVLIVKGGSGWTRKVVVQ